MIGSGLRREMGSADFFQEEWISCSGLREEEENDNDMQRQATSV